MSTRKTIYLAQDRYVAVLGRQRQRIEGGLPLQYWDDRHPGEKDMQCTWGLCSKEPELWPDVEDHLFTKDFVQTGRPSPKYMAKGQLCPFDTDETPKGHVHDAGDPTGCYYRCLVFQAKKDELPDRKRALELYDERLRQVSPRDGDKKPVGGPFDGGSDG